ncbi:hypothetical protein [Neobacillus niacini]|nr:hypothetical protein [Neobacillus niacini]MCM3763925.1 hypothetical protein [Neobacillus niacini]
MKLNKELWGKAEKDHLRKHYQKDWSISELFEEDKAAFLLLSAKNMSV